MSARTKKFLRVSFYAFFISMLVFFVVFFDNFMRYFKFVTLCGNDGGLMVYEKLERDVGWRSNNYFDGFFVVFIEGAKFVRFPYVKDDNKEYDLYYKGGDRLNMKSYEKRPSFFGSDPVYEVVSESGPVKDWPMIKKVDFKFVKISDRAVMAEYYDFNLDLTSKGDLLYWGRLPGVSCSESLFRFYEELKDLF